MKTKSKYLEWANVKAKLNVDETKLAQDVKLLRDEIQAWQLKELRRKLKLTQKQVATTLEVSQARVSKLEVSDVASIEVGTLMRYAEAMGGSLKVVIEINGDTLLIADRQPS